MDSENTKFTFRDLKRIINKMPESRLGDNVVVWEDEKAIHIEGVLILEENYVSDGDVAVCPISIIRENIAYDKKYGRYDPDYYDLTTIYPKGTRILQACEE